MRGGATVSCNSGRSIRSNGIVRSIVFWSSRVLALFITLIIVSVLTFTAFSAVKGEGALMTLGTQATSESAAAARRALGTDASLARQYASWITGLLHGELGVSFRYKQSVGALIAHTLPVTLAIGGGAFLFAIVVGIMAGILTVYARGVAGAALEGATLLCLSVPEFFLSVIVICVFSLALRLFVPGVGGRSVFFAAAVIATPQAAIMAKFVSQAISVELHSLYVRTARGWGASHLHILIRHVLPNALVSLIPLVAMMAVNIFTGQVIVEQVFGIAGVGRLLVGAVMYRDLPLCRALVLGIAAITAVLNFAADAAVHALDTRTILGSRD